MDCKMLWYGCGIVEIGLVFVPCIYAVRVATIASFSAEHDLFAVWTIHDELVWDGVS